MPRTISAEKLKAIENALKAGHSQASIIKKYKTDYYVLKRYFPELTAKVADSWTNKKGLEMPPAAKQMRPQKTSAVDKRNSLPKTMRARLEADNQDSAYARAIKRRERINTATRKCAVCGLALKFDTGGHAFDRGIKVSSFNLEKNWRHVSVEKAVAVGGVHLVILLAEEDIEDDDDF